MYCIFVKILTHNWVYIYMLKISYDDNKEYNPAIYFTLVKMFLKSCQAFEFHCQVAGLTARGVSMAIQGSWYATAILLSFPATVSYCLLSDDISSAAYLHTCNRDIFPGLVVSSFFIDCQWLSSRSSTAQKKKREFIVDIIFWHFKKKKLILIILAILI